MALELGIVGLPLVGKSTIFSAMVAAGGGGAVKQEFTSVKPNVAFVAVPDDRLKVINQYIESEKIVPAQMRVVDIAGIARGASEGMGMGNKFLAHIREVDAIMHVVRCFENADVAHPDGSLDAARDIETLDMELVLADLESVAGSVDRAQKAARTKDKEAVARLELLQRCHAQLNEGKPVRQMTFNAEELKLLRHFGLLTSKKVLYVANTDESDAMGEGPLAQQVKKAAEEQQGAFAAVCGKLEAELAELEEKDRQEMLESMGLKEPALVKLTHEAYRLLGLHSFFTAGEPEIRAWTIPTGATAPQAAAKRAKINGAIFSRGATSSTPPAAIASRGIPNTTQLASSCAIVYAPESCISRKPSAPSLPMPVRITPMALLPAFCAADRKSTSTEGRCRLTGADCEISVR